MTRCRVPGDKSIAHRALILAPFASGRSVLRGLPAGLDVQSTATAMRALGADLRATTEGALLIEGGLDPAAPPAPIECGNSGTTARLLAGVLAGLGVPGELTGDRSLRRRPMDRVVYPLQAMGAPIRYLGEHGTLPVRFEGRASGALRPLRHRPRVASAQVKSALLLAGLLDRTRVDVIEPGQSRDHSERLLAWMGAPVTVQTIDDLPRLSFDPVGWDGRLRPLDMEIPGDLSSAAFLIVASLLTGQELVVDGVGLNPTRTDFLDVLRSMGAEVDTRLEGAAAGESWGSVRIEPGPLRPLRIAPAMVPGLLDEIPALAVLAARVPGTSVIEGAAELRHKESDRLALIARNLNRLGVDCEEEEDGLRIRGSEAPLSGAVETDGDHRLAMAFGVLACLPGMEIEVGDPAAVAVSFPAFWEELDALVSQPVRARRPMPNDTDDMNEPREFAIAIDGPAASGKSTTASRVAETLGALHLSSGELYRAITWVSLREGWIDDADFGSRLGELPVELVAAKGGFEPRVRGLHPGEGLDDPDVVARVSDVSARAVVRERVTETVRQAARGRPVVSDGRDVGTTVFPQAPLKVFLVASSRERARRRLLDYGHEPSPETIEREAAALEARDRADSTRDLSPLRRAADAVEIDTTRLSPEQVVERIVQLARQRGLAAGPY